MVAGVAPTDRPGDRGDGDARLFPFDGRLVQDALGAAHAGAFDLGAGCSGFIYALSMATDVVRAGSAEHVLVVGAETLSRITDWTDRNTCVLFGDGAGAVVVSAVREECGVLASVLGSDGSGGELLIVPAGGSRARPPWRRCATAVTSPR